ncbi:hypothetical protein G6L01_018025 [Agrobacterium vitis]|nr:hypothetical protein [Agrobacterium vitis]WEO74180.1 hypothetical protein G6L01_018025 [Agrobacterium vitis]
MKFFNKIEITGQSMILYMQRLGVKHQILAAQSQALSGPEPSQNIPTGTDCEGGIVLWAPIRP